MCNSRKSSNNDNSAVFGLSIQSILISIIILKYNRLKSKVNQFKKKMYPSLFKFKILITTEIYIYCSKTINN